MTKVPDDFPVVPVEQADSPPKKLPAPAPDPEEGSTGHVTHFLTQFLQVCSSTFHCKSWVSYWRLMGFLLVVSVPVTAVVVAILLVRAIGGL